MKPSDSVQWDPVCYKQCSTHINPVPLQAVTVNKETPQIPELPAEYADLAVAFSKTNASQLPPHHRSDCAIDFMPGTTPPKGGIFPLSQPESDSMKKYIEEELAKGFFRPSTSPASASFFCQKERR